MSNVSLTDLKSLYITNFRNKVVSTLSPYNNGNAPPNTNTAGLKSVPNSYDNFPLIGSAFDLRAGDTISISKFNSLMQATADFFGCIRGFQYGLMGNTGSQTSYFATGYVNPSSWYLFSGDFPEVAGQAQTDNTNIVKIKMAEESAKLAGKPVSISAMTAWFDNMATQVIRASSSIQNGVSDYPDLRVCHSSCHTSCHSSCHTSYPPAGTLERTYCSGVDLYGVYDDGNGGTYNALIQANSTQCGYITPVAPVAPWGQATLNGYASYGTSFAEVYINPQTNGHVAGFSGPVNGNSIDGIWLPQGASLDDYEMSWYYTGHPVSSTYPQNQWMPMTFYAELDDTDPSNGGSNGAGFSSIVYILIRNKRDNSLRTGFQVNLNCTTTPPPTQAPTQAPTQPPTQAPTSPPSTFDQANLDGLIIDADSTGAGATAKLTLNADGTWTAGWTGTSHYQSVPNGRWMNAGQNAGNFQVMVTNVVDQTQNGYFSDSGGDASWANMGSGWNCSLFDSSGTNSGGSNYQFTLQIQNIATGQIYNASIYLHAGGGCFAVGTLLRTPKGDVAVEDIQVGDVVSSFDVPTMIDESVPGWLDWTTDNIKGFDPTTTATVKGVRRFTEPRAMVINGIKSTLNHVYFVFDGANYCWKEAQNMKITDQFIDDHGKLIPISSMQLLNEVTEFVVVDVETLDTLQVKSGDIYLMSHNATYAM